jgi:hypothetical protein
MAGHLLDLKLWLAGAVVLAAAGASTAMGQAVAPPQTVEEALHEMADAAGVIFTGQVMVVHHVAGSGGAGGVVEVTFRVDQAVKGSTAGGTYVLREWAGLWDGGNLRYRVGQRLLMLLWSPGAAGLSSPVGGMDGAIPILGGVTEIAPGATEVGATSVAPPNAPAAAAMVDLRWVAARMLRDAPYMTTTAGVLSAASVPVGGSGGSGTGAAGGSGTDGNGSVAAAGTSVGTVMGMLSNWEAERGAQ